MALAPSDTATPLAGPDSADVCAPELKFANARAMLDYMEKSPAASEYSKGIIPTIVEDAPEYAAKLLNNRSDGFIIVDKASMKLYRYDKYGLLQQDVQIACSRYYGTKHKKADNRTPEGFFSIDGIYDSTEWLYTDDWGNQSSVKGQFGPRFMRLKIPNTTQIGIHGTCSPWSMGGRRSHGCIRVLNENILTISKIAKPGWPVIVSPGGKDMYVNQQEGYPIPAVRPTKDSKKVTPVAFNLKSNIPPVGCKKPSAAAADSVSHTGDSPATQASSGVAPDMKEPAPAASSHAERTDTI